MSLRDRILTDMTAAMKAKETARLETLRMVKAELQRQEIDAQKQLDDPAMIALLNRLVKQRRESADAFARGGRSEMADKELAEAALLESYLPKPLDEAALAKIVEEAVAETNASTPKDVGVVMKAVMAKLAGKNADGKAVNALVRAKLGA